MSNEISTLTGKRGRDLSGIGSRLALFSVILTLAAFAISANAMPPVLTTVAGEFRVSINSFGYLFSLQFFIFMTASFAGGFFIEKTGIKPGVLVSFGLAGLSLSFFLAPLISGFWMLMIWISFLGFCGGLVETFASVLTSAYDKPGSGRMLSLSQVFYCIGAIAAPQIVALLFGKQISWKSIFMIFGFLELIMTAVFIIFSFDDIKGRDPVIEKEIRGEAEGKSTSLFSSRFFLLLAFSVFIYVLIESFLVFWLPAYFETYYHLSPALSAWRMSFYWYGLLAGRMIMTFIPDKVSLKHILFISAAGMLICSFLLIFRWSSPIVILLVILTGFSAGPIWSALVALAGNTGGSPRFVAGVIGAGSLGASAGPLLSAFIIKRWGFSLYFPALFAGVIILSVLIIFTEFRIRKQELCK